jgi:hypothetical protein
MKNGGSADERWQNVACGRTLMPKAALPLQASLKNPPIMSGGETLGRP